MSIPYRKVPESWVTNPYGLPTADQCLLFMMSIWSGKHETDGRLTVTQTRALCDLIEIDPTHRSRHLSRMVERGALTKLDDGSYRVVDYCDTTHEERLTVRQREAEKKRRQRSKRQKKSRKADSDEGGAVASTWLDSGERPPGDILDFPVQNPSESSHVSPLRSAAASLLHNDAAGDASPWERVTPADDGPGPSQAASDFDASPGEDGRRTGDNTTAREAQQRFRDRVSREAELERQKRRYLRNCHQKSVHRGQEVPWWDDRSDSGGCLVCHPRPASVAAEDAEDAW